MEDLLAELLSMPEKPLPPYTLYLCSEKSGRWGIIPCLAPRGRWTLQDEIERAKRHASGKEACDFWYEVAERGSDRRGGKTVFSTKREPNTVDSQVNS
jgi:hypothetical protein